MSTQLQKQAREPQVGDIYAESRRDTRYQICYIDEQVVLLRSEDTRRDGEQSHRIQRRTAFEDCLDAGQFEHKPDSEIDLLEFETQDWSTIDLIGEATSENLHEAGYETNLDIQQASDDELEAIGGIGAKSLQNLREYAQ